MTYFNVTIILFLGSLYCQINAKTVWDKEHEHPRNDGNPDNQDGFIYEDWYELSQRRIQNAIEQAHQMINLHKPAKNVILFMGDGMGISTMSAARIFMAQQRNLTGEDAQLSWERMPYSALSRTYSTDKMVSDSAATATAMVCGVKTKNSIIALNQNASAGVCETEAGNNVTSILHHSINEGKWTGVVTTASVVHASPACNFAHSADRGWYSDADIPTEDREQCPDIATQLINDPLNQQIKVILGGGRQYMTPNDEPDREYPTENGEREDNRNLIQEWLANKDAEGIPENAYAYVDNLDDFNNIDEESIQYLMGLFEPDHMQYEVNRESDTFGEPSLAEMVAKAISILQRSENGYYLFIESSKIDSAHHANWAQRALVETVMMSDAVQNVLDMTSENDTLLVITADHSHVFTMSAYPDWGSNILTFSDNMIGEDDKPYATLGYTNGPGFENHRHDEDENEQPRMDLTGMEDIMIDPDFRHDAGIYRSSETHGGEDVGIFARGPMAHLFHGVQEQSYIGNLMMYASCVGRNKDLCEVGVADICEE